MKTIWIAALVMVAASSVPAMASSKFTGSLVPTPPDCYSGPDFCKNGLPQTMACNIDNSGCDGGAVLKAKLTFSDRLVVKLSVSNLTDNDGNLVTTTAASTPDDHVLKLSFNQCITETGAPGTCNTPVDVFVKVDFENGKAKVSADLAEALAEATSGSALLLLGASLHGHALNPALCSGGNDAATIAARNDDGNCDTGAPYAVFGVQRP